MTRLHRLLIVLGSEITCLAVEHQLFFYFYKKTKQNKKAHTTRVKSCVLSLLELKGVCALFQEMELRVSIILSREDD